MNTLVKLARMMGKPYRTVYSYARGQKQPKIDTARLLAAITGDGTDAETLIWMSKDPVKIGKLVQRWRCGGSA